MDWTSALAGMEEACAEVFDVDPCRLQPRKPGLSVNHGPGQNDGTRAVFDFMGTLELEPPSSKIWRHLSPDPGIVGQGSDTVSYDAVVTAHTGKWPYQPNRGDWIVAAGVNWRIAAIGQDGTVRPAYFLVRA
jgi:hypothetical protein